MKFYTVCKQIAACAFSALLLAACFEDKGNYDYRDINEVTIEGIDTENVYQLYAYQSTLTINPVITSTIGDGQGYEYTWRIVPRQATEEDGTLDQYIVSHEKNLVYPVQLEDGDYTGFFEVKDPTTGVSWVQDFYLTVQSQGSEGWMALCDDNGKARLDLIGKNSEGEDVLFPDLWADNDLDIGAPQRLFFVAGMEEEFFMPLIVTDKGSYFITGTDFHVGEDTDLKWYFGVAGDRIDIAASGVELYTTDWMYYWWIVNEAGELYTTEASVSAFFSYPINLIDGKTEFKAAPYIGLSYTYNDTGADWDYNYAAIFYDETHRQFLAKYGANNYPSVMQCSGTQRFDVQTGRDMVYMDSHVEVDGLQVAVLKEPGGTRHYLYGFTLGYGKIEQSFYGEIGGPVAEATHFALHPTLNALFFSTSNAIYRVSLSNPSNVTEVASLPGEEIASIRFNKILGWTSDKSVMSQLMVASNKTGAADVDGNTGVFRLYSVPDLSGDLAEEKRVEGLGRVIDVVYKERF